METRVVYQRDANGIYLGEAIAYESSLEPGVFHLPADCVWDAPPPTREHEIAIWNGDAWSVVPDHRGETWCVGGAAVVVDFVGDPAERGYSTVPPEPSLENLRRAKIAAVTNVAATLLAAGAPIGSLHIALDDGSRADLTAMAATATAASAGVISWPESYARGWIAIENVRIPLATPVEGLALAVAAGNFYAAIVQHARDLKDASLVAVDEASLAAIDVAAGWPAS